MDGLPPSNAGDQSSPPVKVAARPTLAIDPPIERLRQYKYRFAQSMVFGLPVAALYIFGPTLGGPEAGRWTGFLQSLLAAWVLYVGAWGMIGGALLRRRLTLDALAGGVALATYLVGVAEFANLLNHEKTLGNTRGFFVSTMIVCCWSSRAWLLHGKMRHHSE